MNAAAASADTRQRLIDAGAELFHTRSYGDVGVAAICAAAGVQKGSFYHFFKSKSELTIAVIDHHLEMFRQHIIAPSFQSDIAPTQRFAAFGERAAQFQESLKAGHGQMPGCPFGNLATELSTLDDSVRTKLNSALNHLRIPFIAAIEDQLALDRDKPAQREIDIDASADAMVAFVEGLMLLAKTRDDPNLIRTLGPAILELRVFKPSPADSVG